MNGSRSTSCIRHPQAPGQGLHTGPRESTRPDRFIAVLVMSQAHLTFLSELFISCFIRGSCTLSKLRLRRKFSLGMVGLLFPHACQPLAWLCGAWHTFGDCTGMQLCDSAWGCSSKMFWFQFPECEDDPTWPYTVAMEPVVFFSHRRLDVTSHNLSNCLVLPCYKVT